MPPGHKLPGVGTHSEDGDDEATDPGGEGSERTARARDAAVAAALAATDPDRAVEVGVGHRVGVARELADRGVAVTATDVDAAAVDAAAAVPGVRAVADDVTDPDVGTYRGADLVYALRCPPELHGRLAAAARWVGADAAFTTLGGEPPAVDATPERAGPTTLYRVDGRG